MGVIRKLHETVILETQHTQKYKISMLYKHLKFIKAVQENKMGKRALLELLRVLPANS